MSKRRTKQALAKSQRRRATHVKQKVKVKPVSTTASFSSLLHYDLSFIKKDLRRTGLASLVVLVVLVALSFYL